MESGGGSEGWSLQLWLAEKNVLDFESSELLLNSAATHVVKRKSVMYIAFHKRKCVRE